MHNPVDWHLRHGECGWSSGALWLGYTYNMKKGGPEFRVVGNAEYVEKYAAKRKRESAFYMQDAFTEEEEQLLAKTEYPKSDKEKALIRFANDGINELLEEAGMDTYDVPEENIHILPPEVFDRFGTHDATASTRYYYQAVFANAAELRGRPVSFGTTMVHELMHLKAPQTLEVRDDEENASEYRAGISAPASIKRSREIGDHEHGRGVHEALIVLTEKEMFEKMLKLPELAEQKAWMESSEYEAFKQKIHATDKVPLDEFIWINKDGKTWDHFAYWWERKTLLYACEEICNEFPEYETVNAVVKEFRTAHLTGRLLPIARLTEKTFGSGSFRILMDMKADRESASLTREHLGKMRRKQLASKQ